MAINGIGSNSPIATMESRLETAARAHVAFDASKSSLVSMSESQQDGFFDGVWSLITWPFRALGSLWAWMTGSSDAASGSKAASKGKKGSSDAAEEFVAVFKKSDEVEFDSDKFREAYGAMSSDEKKAYRTMLWVAGEFQVVDSGNKDWATKLVTKKGDFAEEDTAVLKAAGNMFKFADRLDSLCDRYEKLADEMLAELDNEESDADFKKDLDKLDKDFRKLPKEVRDRVEHLAHVFGPALTLFSKKEREGSEEDRVSAYRLKAQAHAMKLLSENHYLAVGDAAVRSDLERMLRVVGQKVVGDGEEAQVAEGDVVAEYNQMSSAARKALADVIGYNICKPASGEQYLYGRVKVDNKSVAPDAKLVLVALKNLVQFDGGEVPRGLAGIRYTQEAVDEEYEE